MNGNRNPRGPCDLESVIQPDDELQDRDDETFDISNTLFTDILEENEETGDTETGPPVDNDYSEMDDFEEAWTEDSPVEPSSLPSDLEHDVEDDAGWKVDGPDETMSFDAGWFITDVRDDAADDGGAEGPAEPESFIINDGKWAALDSDEDDSVDEDVFAVMKRMDVDLIDFDLKHSEIGDLSELDVQVSFLGPEHGRIADALFYQGRPLGVGEYLFMLGADQQLHPVISTHPNDLEATGFAWYEDSIYIGTLRRGALVTRDTGRTSAPINSWYTAGFLRKGEVSTDECSTSFSLLGHFHPTHFQLFGRTGEGQIYVSKDGGESWQGPLLKGCCIALSACTGNDTVWALTCGPSNVVSLHKSRDLTTWDTVLLPKKISRVITPMNGCAAVGGKTVAVLAKNSSQPLFLTADQGVTWQEISALSNVTALVLDPEDPDFIAAAISQADGRAQVIVTFDRGKTRHVALTVEPDSENGIQVIRSLAMNLGSARRLLAVTASGAFLITFPSDEMKH